VHPWLRRGGVLGCSLRRGVEEKEPERDSYEISELESDLNVIDLALNDMDFAHEKQGPGIVGELRATVLVTVITKVYSKTSPSVSQQKYTICQIRYRTAFNTQRRVIPAECSMRSTLHKNG